MKFTTKIIGLIGLIGLIGPITQAQVQPDFMATWKASSYVPADYLGKVLPTGDSKIEAALEIIDGGKIADLSRLDIRWLINGKDQKIGRGLKAVSFNADAFKSDQIVDITVANYRGQSLEHRMIIPLASPEVAVVGGPTIFRALPYFFNIAQLSQAQYSWTANGVSVLGSGDNPNAVSLDLQEVSPGASVNLSVVAQNLLKPLEVASRSIQFYK